MVGENRIIKRKLRKTKIENGETEQVYPWVLPVTYKYIDYFRI
jgi:hypothetical protein